ncbi:AhpA/YtjB family protein [Pseudomonas matsuisoli]|uniref:Histidine kinase n=1 Tax=Pseudomonas matsuisoli TaxID=1515666 RepID=A0A917PXP9_9PSED|nr:AhpA/YtjB family protein [Pseudomonas matsuisoli]GGJ97525.1 histidine kinase [Pseudomonas matsuisoli]
MNRPAPVKSDNFFVLLFNALRQRRVPLALRIAFHSVVLVTLALVIYAWVMGMQFKHAMQEQADALGQSLTTQTASSARDLLVANDVISLNVLLNNLVRNPLVAHAAIYSVDNRILAEAGERPPRSMLNEDDGLYTTPITFQEVIAGHLRVTLDMKQFQQPMTISLQSMGILSLILLALALTLSLRLGRYISTPLLQLRLWLRDPDYSAPGANRMDEIGDLARQLEARLAPPRPEPEPEVEEDDYDEEEAPSPRLRGQTRPAFDLANDELDSIDFDEDDIPRASRPQPSAAPYKPLPATVTHAPAPLARDVRENGLADAFDELDDNAVQVEPSAVDTTRSAALAIQLGAQDQLRRLPKARLVELLERYRGCLDRAAQLYQGELHTLGDGSTLVLFHSNDSDDYLTHAICCGELLRALGHALQVEVADSGITLQLQLGLTLGNDLRQLGQAELLLNETAQSALALSQHSRNLLLVERSVGEDPVVRQRARIRTIASPEGASCVERLLEPYPSLLERQLSRMQDSTTRS